MRSRGNSVCDLTRLYVNNTKGDSLTVIDPSTAKVVDEIPVLDPYNLYFTPNGKYAIAVAERYRRLDFRDPKTWTLVKSVPIPQPAWIIWPSRGTTAISWPARSIQADRGFVTIAYHVQNQRGEIVLTMRAIQIVRRRATRRVHASHGLHE